MSSRPERAYFGAAPGRGLLQDPSTHVERVAGVDGLLPPKLVDAWRAETCLALVDDAARDDCHGHRRRMPSARGQAPEMRLGCFLVRQMERLRVVLLREVKHLLARHLIGAELGLCADTQILEIDHWLFGHSGGA